MKYLILSVSLILYLPVFGQQKLPVIISVFNEGTAVPFTKIKTSPLHPGIKLGTELPLKAGRHLHWTQGLYLGYYYHRRLAHGVFLKTEVSYEYVTKSGISLSAQIGAGYLHVFRTSTVYTLDDGVYEKKVDGGKSRFMGSFSMDLGFYIVPGNYRIFVRYEPWLQYPFSPGFIPLMTHLNTHLGIRFNP